MSQRPLTRILLQKYIAKHKREPYRDTNWWCIYHFCHEKGILLQNYRDRNGSCIAILFKSIGVRGRFDQSRFLGRGCNEALFSEKKGFFSEKGGGNSVNQRFGKEFYREGNSVKRFGHSLNRRALQTEKLLSSSPSRESALI